MTTPLLSRKDFSYEFPPELIATHPLARRDASRLLVLNRDTGEIRHDLFQNITRHFRAGDVLVFNDSKVFPARLLTRRPTGGKQEILLVSPVDSDSHRWQILVDHAVRMKIGERFEWDGLALTIASENGPEREARLEFDGDLFDVLERVAHVPLPPYIHRPDEPADRERYQTVFARETGSIAAPTAGLHFTQESLETLQRKGVIMVSITLHIGPGTFLPVRAAALEDHRMHWEFFSVSPAAATAINHAKNENRRITAVGTTTTRVLESLARQGYVAPERYAISGAQEPITSGPGKTDIFIRPPFDFKLIDRLITNFHQPQSTLLILVCAFAGRERVLLAYAEAIRQGYRLFSYGDAMLIGKGDLNKLPICP